MAKIFVPSVGLSSWQSLLADPQKHWVDGYSAKELALAWETAEGFPKEVSHLFKESNEKWFEKLDILYAFPEFKVPIPGGIRASQNDLYVLAKGTKGTVVIMVEGKVREDFGPLVIEKIKQGQAKERLEFLVTQLGIKGCDLTNIRYQLLHRTASAILEAEKVGAQAALMLVHSFSPEKAHFDDYKNFAALFGLEAEPDKIVGPINVQNTMIPVYLGWCNR